MSFKKWPVDFSKPQLFLAPMEGVVDAVNRELITSLGATDLCVTEFVRVVNTLLPSRIFYQYCPELQNSSQTSFGTPVVVQLLGSDISAMAENAARAIELGAAGIDLNFGCPAKTVNRNDGGAALLKTPERIFAIISAVRRAVNADFSVSAKIRLGFEDKTQALELAQAAESGGASWLVVHARTKMDGYKPPAYWEHLPPLHEALEIPLVANGEVWTMEDYWRCRKISTCDHVMIGRGWVANPGLGLEIKNNQNKIPWNEWQSYFLQFVDLSLGLKHERYAVQRTKQLAKMMSQSYGESAVLLEKIKKLESLDALKMVLLNDFAVEHTRIPKAAPIVAKKFLPATPSTGTPQIAHEIQPR